MLVTIAVCAVVYFILYGEATAQAALEKERRWSRVLEDALAEHEAKSNHPSKP